MPTPTAPALMPRRPPRVPVRPLASAFARPQYSLGFALFILLNATLFIRPAEVIPALLGLEIYQFVILACLIASFPVVLAQLSAAALERRPITLCVIFVVMAVIVANLAHAELGRAFEDGLLMVKTLIYYLLFVGLVTTPGRIRSFLGWFFLFATVVTALAVLQYHGYIDLPTLSQLQDTDRDANGQEFYIIRLRGTGIFQDPNDLCILIVVTIIIGIYQLTDKSKGLFRLACLGPLALLFYALTLTQSRGGLLALLAGGGIYCLCRFGRTGVLVGGVAAVALLGLLAGRQASLSTSSGTSQERIQIWSDGLILMRSSPIFGVGTGVFAEQIGHVAHNSYLQAFTELGILGGMAYLGAFYLAAIGLTRFRTGGHRILDPELRRLHPYLLGAVGSYMVGMMSLTLDYIIPTYTMLALANSYLGMTTSVPLLPRDRFDTRLLQRVLGISVVFLIFLTVFVRLLVVR